MYILKRNEQQTDPKRQVRARCRNIQIINSFSIKFNQISCEKNYLKCVMKGSVVYVKEALCQQHHRAEPVTPQHLLRQVGAPRLARHPYAHKQTHEE